MSYMDKRLEKVYQQNADGTYSYDPSQLETTDWGELVTRTAFTHNHQIFSFSRNGNFQIVCIIGIFGSESTYERPRFQTLYSQYKR